MHFYKTYTYKWNDDLEILEWASEFYKEWFDIYLCRKYTHAGSFNVPSAIKKYNGFLCQD